MLKGGPDLGTRPQAMATSQAVAERESAAEAVEVLLQEEQPSVVVKIAKVAAYGGAAGVGVVTALKVISGGKEAKRREEEAKAYLESMLKSEEQLKAAAAADALDGFSLDDAPEGSLQAAARAGQVTAPPPPPPSPVATTPMAAPAAEPKRKGLNLFSKRPTVTLPTVQELIEGDTPQAVLCKTVAFGMSAPADLTAAMISGELSDEPIEENGEAMFAMSVMEELQGAYNASTEAGLSPKEMAGCLEQV